MKDISTTLSMSRIKVLITYVSLLLNNRYFLSNYLHNYVNWVQFTVVKAIILF